MFDGPWETCMLVRGLNPSECASWVQAWGSIGAILAAVSVAYVQHRQGLRQQRRIAEDGRRQAIAAHLARGRSLFAELGSITPLAFSPELADWTHASQQMGVIMAERDLFDSLPVSGLPSGDAIDAVREISQSIKRWTTALSNVISMKGAGHATWEIAARSEAEIGEAAARLQAEIQVLEHSARSPE